MIFRSYKPLFKTISTSKKPKNLPAPHMNVPKEYSPPQSPIFTYAVFQINVIKKSTSNENYYQCVYNVCFFVWSQLVGKSSFNFIFFHVNSFSLLVPQKILYGINQIEKIINIKKIQNNNTTLTNCVWADSLLRILN